jgi:hypothetical protein
MPAACQEVGQEERHHCNHTDNAYPHPPHVTEEEDFCPADYDTQNSSYRFTLPDMPTQSAQTIYELVQIKE